jgi:hypothetical protein
MGVKDEILVIQRKRQRGRPKLRWIKKVEENLREKGWGREDVLVIHCMNTN